MASRHPLFDRRKLTLRPLREREHDLDLSVIRPLVPAESSVPKSIRSAAKAMVDARRRGAPVIFMMGGHVLRSGVQRYIIDLLERDLVTGLAGNGACAVHDFELALIGATTESVARYIADGRFGLWSELGELNRAFSLGAAEGLGAGECVGRLIEEGDFPHRDISLFAAAYRLGRPFTVHIGIGNDILHEHPTCDGAALGAVSYTDFLIFTRLLSGLEGGVFANFGSAVTGPEVFLKALAMSRNATGGPRRFTTLVGDLHELPEDVSGEAEKTEPLYFYRPWKTILVRSVRDGGLGLYARGRHEHIIPFLWSAVNEEERR